MLKIILKLCVLISVFGYLNAASTSANTAFANTCNVKIIEFTNKAKQAYTKSTTSALYSKSVWVKRSMDQMMQNVVRFITQASILNSRYQTNNQYQASQQMRDIIATMIEIITTARSVATTAKVSNAGTITTEINAIVSICQEVRESLVPYTQFNIFVSYSLMSSVYPDGQLNKLRNAVLRAAKALNTVMQSVSNKVINDTNFEPLALALDFQLAVSSGNNAAANVALSAQLTYYNVGIKTSTAGAMTTLNAQQDVLEAYQVSIIVEFNGFGAYGQTAVNAVINLIIRLYVSSRTVQNVYIPLGQQLLAGLAEAYTAINQEFLIAIKHCKAQIESTKTGENGSGSSDQSNYASDSGEGNNYSMKGEVRKCEKRGRGLTIAMQNQYRKSTAAAVCGGISINNIMTRVVANQARVANCGVNLIVDFRVVLEEVKKVIAEELNKNLLAFSNCGKKAGEADGHSGEVSQNCIQNNVDLKFNKLRNKGFALVKQLKNGGKYINKARNCRKNTRAALVTQLGYVKSSFSSCSGISSFSTTL